MAGEVYNMPTSEYAVCMLLCTLADQAEELLCLVNKPLAKRHLLECAKYARWAAADLKQCNGVVA